jgi:8-oxo-dGTP pyrophosphatase MutT (NUDIX family)
MPGCRSPCRFYITESTLSPSIPAAVDRTGPPQPGTCALEAVLPGPTRDFAATTFVVQDERTLLLWHKKSQAWLPPGGHIEPDELPDAAAVREVAEETGLCIELLGRLRRWGKVQVLHTPVCVLLEEISADHQHIDLIYFGRVTGGQLRVDPEEADGYRWYTCQELAGPEIARDIRVLGRRAIAAVSARPRAPGDEPSARFPLRQRLAEDVDVDLEG